MANPRTAAPPDEERSPFGPEEMALTLACFFMAGSVLGFLSLLGARAPEANVALLVVNAGLALVVGLVLLKIGGRLPATAVSLFLSAGTLAITSAGYFDGHAGRRPPGGLSAPPDRGPARPALRDGPHRRAHRPAQPPRLRGALR